MIPKTAELYGESIRHRLLEWFRREGRLFPWREIERADSRGEGELIHDPYLILVSEVMLQQTQTARVVEKLPQFLNLFPTVEALADSGRADLLRAWQGMGYNSRALRLRETARAIVADYGGTFPSDPDTLRTLPGIGPYTASAILCFAFGHDLAVIDVNVARVLSRIFHKCYTPAQVFPERDVAALAARMVPAGEGYHWHQALMDLGAVICTARNPSCGECPLSAFCLSAGFPDIPSLFNPATLRRPEPSFRGEPRRVWRGRVVEVLRRSGEGSSVAEIVRTLIPADLFGELPEAERRAFLEILRGLVRDGLAESPGIVREGELQEWDLLRLPEM